MKTVDVVRVNQQLVGFSEVVQFNLAVDAERTAYTLSLTLANEDGVSLTLVCGDVQNLELNPAGNGFEQMVRLKVTDMRDDGLDRVHYSVEEMEHETLFLHCASLEVKTA
jgi:hypothetical protein